MYLVTNIVFQDFPALLPSSLLEISLPPAWVKTPTLPRDIKAVINLFPVLTGKASEQPPLLSEKVEPVAEELSGTTGEPNDNCDKNIKVESKEGVTASPLGLQNTEVKTGPHSTKVKPEFSINKMVNNTLVGLSEVNNSNAAPDIGACDVDAEVDKAQGDKFDAINPFDQDNFEFDTRVNPVVLGIKFQDDSTEVGRKKYKNTKI